MEHPSFHCLLDFLRPKSSQSLLSRFTIGGNQLDSLYDKALEWQNIAITNAVDNKEYFGWIVDGWEMANADHVEGILYRSVSAAFLLDALEGLDTHHAISIARQWEEKVIGAHIIAEDATKGTAGVSFPQVSKYFLSNDAGQCRRARLILSLWHPHILFLKCKAHQVNLMVGHILENTDYASWVSKAIASASKIKKLSSKWYKRLQNFCDQRYGKQAATTIVTLADTRWNSLQGVLASLCRIQGAIEDFIHYYRTDKDLPDACKCWRDEDFWHKIKEAEMLIHPFCEASFLMQSDDNTLANVFLMMVNLYQSVQVHFGTPDVCQMVTADLKKRWAEWEQPLYFLAFCLHPCYKDCAIEIVNASETEKGEWPTTPNKLCARRLAHCAKFYYQKHLLSPFTPGTNKYNQDVGFVEVKFYQWMRRKEPQNAFSYDPDNYPSVVAWFQDNQSIFGPSLTQFAVFLFCCPVQGASCERLFKDFSRYHTKGRNRLSREKMMKSTQIKYDLKT